MSDCLSSCSLGFNSYGHGGLFLVFWCVVYSIITGVKIEFSGNMAISELMIGPSAQ